MQLDFYEKANDYMINSWKSWEEGKVAKSWGYTIPARLAYLCETIINLVTLPFAIIGVTFGTLHALCTWNRNSEIFQTTYRAISKTTNHCLWQPDLTCCCTQIPRCEHHTLSHRCSDHHRFRRAPLCTHAKMT